MYLSELTISGFKSFAKKGELAFAAPITAIVGPNGSGKSNVAEAFRFVLGEQSVKAMRGKRGEDLIWGGSSAVSRANRAHVCVTLDNRDRTLALDYDEVRIERTVHRDGQNEYRINGSSVRLRDILELLSGANIGATGHHIISQGEADRILSAAPRERREMIEDALGLKSYQYKKQEAERKLQKTLDNMQQVELLRKEAAPHLQYLERQVKKLQRSRELREQLREKYAEYLRREDTYLAQAYDALTARRKEPAAAIADAERRLREAREALAALENTDAASELAAAEATLRDAVALREQCQREQSRLEGQVTILERRLAQRSSEEGAAPESVPASTLAPIVTDGHERMTQLRTTEDAAAVREAFSRLLERLDACLAAAEPVTVDTSADEAEIAELRQQVAVRSDQLAAAETTERQARERYEAQKTQHETEAHEGREAEREVFQVTGELRDHEAELVRIDTELAAIERDREEFKRELTEAVALIGRGAAAYYEHVITDESGTTQSVEDIAAEPREQQRARRAELERLKIRLEEVGGGATDEVVKEHEQAKERDAFLEQELADLSASAQTLRTLIGELEEKLAGQFDTGIEKISAEFNRFFTLMFGGGSAALERVTEKPKRRGSDADEETPDAGDEDAPVRPGVELAVSLPNKRVKGLEMLSGGERALTSIALIFAMSQVNPPPFLILDETDAALDEANSRRYGDMIEALAERSQLILITHNRETMSRAGVLYGVTMGGDGVSKLLSVKFDDALAHAK